MKSAPIFPINILGRNAEWRFGGSAVLQTKPDTSGELDQTIKATFRNMTAAKVCSFT